MSNIITRDIPDAHISVVEDLNRLLKHVNNHQCADVGDHGIVIKGGAHINSWRSLIRDLYACWQAGEIRGALIKFMLGDALNQGVGLYGEDSSQIFADIPWKKRYIDNICWVCRKVPPENRRLQLHWRMHQAIASLSVEEQRFWIASAVHKHADGNEMWYQEIMSEMQDVKCRELLAPLDPDAKDYWLQVIEAHNPTWGKLRQWITGEVPAPIVPMVASKWVAVQAISVKDRLGLTDEQKDAVMSVMFDLCDRIKDKTVKL